MAQFLRPDSTVTATSFTNGFAAIDESTASDADFAYGANNTAAVLEVGLSNPGATPGSGTTTVRYRIAKTKTGVVDGSGNAVTVTCSVRQGANVIAVDTAKTATGTWTEYSFTPNMSGVSDWNDLRLRFTTSQSGGTTANRRGGAVSWAELEAPDAPVAVTHTTTGALSGSAATLAGSAGRIAFHTTSGALLPSGAVLTGATARFRQHAASGSLTGASAILAGSALRSRLHPYTGTLAGAGGVISGSASRSPPVHAATGVLAGSGAIITASAWRGLPCSMMPMHGISIGIGL